MSSPSKRYMYLVIHLIIVLQQTQADKAGEPVIVRRIDSLYEPFTNILKAKFHISLTPVPKENASKIIESQNLQNPWLDKIPNLNTSIIEHVVLPFLTPESRLVLQMECTAQRPPFTIHPAVIEYVENYFTNISQELAKSDFEIPFPALKASFYTENPRFVNCQRMREHLIWLVKIPIRQIGQWSNLKLIPVPFKLNNKICQWRSKESFVSTVEKQYYRIIGDPKMCMADKACKVQKLHKLSEEAQCLQNLEKCNLNCQEDRKVAITELNTGEILLASLEEEIYIQCGNFSKTIAFDKSGSLKLTIPCYCVILGVELNPTHRSCDSVLNSEFVKPPKMFIDSPVATSSAEASIVPRAHPSPWQIPRRSHRSPAELEILEELSEIKGGTNAIIIFIFLLVLIPLVAYTCCYRLGLFGLLVMIPQRGQAIEIQLGPRTLYPDTRTLEEQTPSIILMVLAAIIIFGIIILCCIFRK